MWLRKALFQVHVWTGIGIGLYLGVIAVTGSILVFRVELSRAATPGMFAVLSWLIDLHDNLLGGRSGRVVNGIGGLLLMLLCVTGAIVWWPGVKAWR
ncbi:MAG: PepSY-associated helix domain protein, partial [Acidobacteria bacterium]|nr:PepSY-associated helix domain protein [Acidobacteriota bacterium]